MIRRKHRGVHVRAFLAPRVYARSGVLAEPRLRANAPIRIKCVGDHSPTPIVCDEEHLPGLIHDEMAWHSTRGGYSVQKSESSGVGIDGVAANRLIRRG